LRAKTVIKSQARRVRLFIISQGFTKINPKTALGSVVNEPQSSTDWSDHEDVPIGATRVPRRRRCMMASRRFRKRKMI
jgi:hypothetical protein